MFKENNQQQGRGQSRPIVASSQSCLGGEKHWRGKTERFSKCEMQDNAEEASVLIPLPIHQKIMAISAKMKQLEWLCYIKAEDLKDGQFIIREIAVPKQRVGAATVHVDDPFDAEWNGTIHRHPMGGTFLSSTDDDSLAGNHQITISVNNDGVYCGKERVKLPCGADYLRDLKISLHLPTPRDLDKFVNESLKNITEQVYTAEAFNRENYETPYGVWKDGVFHPKVDNRDPDRPSAGCVFYCGWCRQPMTYAEMRIHNNIGLCPNCFSQTKEGATKEKGFWTKGAASALEAAGEKPPDKTDTP